MARIFVLALALMSCGGAQAAAPEFDTEHFCADFAAVTPAAAWATWPRRFAC
jgi:hypothetical protein